ncbi:hypothetical protein ACFC6L_15260 [Kitasatospora phosalacinea]|uniref:hypothetical protein n=1 Tax=Kitasatospora phosalacinea TaxID=2065 RepID=UPI0035D9E2D3
MKFHHHWIHDTNQRNPGVDNVASCGNLSRGASRTVIENSSYDHVNNPYCNDTSAAALTRRGSIVVDSTGKQQTNGTTFDPSSSPRTPWTRPPTCPPCSPGARARRATSADAPAGPGDGEGVPGPGGRRGAGYGWPPRSSGIRSPASTAAGRRFSAGGSGQVARSV